MRMVIGVAGQVQVSAGGVCDLGYQAVWCRKYRHPVLAGRVAGRCAELVGAKASGHGWPVVALGLMPDEVHLFVDAHRCGSLSWIANQVKGLISRRLRAEFAHLWSHLPALRPRSYVAATAGAVSAETVRRYAGTQNERRWRKERAR